VGKMSPQRSKIEQLRVMVWAITQVVPGEEFLCVFTTNPVSPLLIVAQQKARIGYA
jgi:hypothetical protein